MKKMFEQIKLKMQLINKGVDDITSQLGKERWVKCLCSLPQEEECNHGLLVRCIV